MAVAVDVSLFVLVVPDAHPITRSQSQFQRTLHRRPSIRVDVLARCGIVADGAQIRHSWADSYRGSRPCMRWADFPRLSIYSLTSSNPAVPSILRVTPRASLQINYSNHFPFPFHLIF